MFDPNGRPPEEWHAYQVVGVCLTVGGMLGGSVAILLDNPLWLLLTVSPAVLAGMALVLEARLMLWCLHKEYAQPRPQRKAKITTAIRSLRRRSTTHGSDAIGSAEVRLSGLEHRHPPGLP